MMSKLLKPTLLAHLVVSVVLGALLFIIPGRFLLALGWAPIDPVLSRVLGAALLAMAWGDLRIRQGIARLEVRLWVEVHLGFTALAGVGVLWHLVDGGWPVIVWILFGVLALFALLWLGVLIEEGRRRA
jgi:hypothetical protein